jgi:arylsulfatase A-like enzyme
VIFTSDNGYMHGEHRIRAEKVQPYEEALRVPLVIRGPGISEGQRVDDPVANVDLAPTILDLARAQVPAGLERPLDGRSLAPYTYGRGDPARAVAIEAKRPPRRSPTGSFVAPSWVGVRTARYVYVEHYRAEVESLEAGFGLPIGVGQLTDAELYDLETDRHELDSRHADPALAATRAALAGAVAQMRACSGVTCQLNLGGLAPR